MFIINLPCDAWGMAQQAAFETLSRISTYIYCIPLFLLVRYFFLRNCISPLFVLDPPRTICSCLHSSSLSPSLSNAIREINIAAYSN